MIPEHSFDEFDGGQHTERAVLPLCRRHLNPAQENRVGDVAATMRGWWLSTKGIDTAVYRRAAAGLYRRCPILSGLTVQTPLEQA
ncbi:hypothetical protein [Neisseria sp.]|uniref:hypothetical protein n=1 Tax=Neisseria sp. TaxID=192066 RepID=UPI0035A0C075